MAVIHPDGAGVTVVQPIQPAAVSLWDVVHDIDFTTETARTWATNGSSNSVGGLDWFAQNITGVGKTYADRIELVAGTGLQIEIGIGRDDSELAPTVNTAPRIEINAATLIAGLANDDTIAFQILVESTGLNDDWQFYGLMLSDGTTGDKWIENATVYYTGGGWPSPFVGSDVQQGDGGRALTVLSPEPPFRELVWYVGSCGFVASADQSATMIDPLSSTAMEVYTVVSSATATSPSATPALDITNGNGKFALHAYYNDALTGVTTHSFTTTWKRLRVLRRAK